MKFIFTLVLIISTSLVFSQEYLDLLGEYKCSNTIYGTRLDTISHYDHQPIDPFENITLKISIKEISVKYYDDQIEKYEIVKEIDKSINAIDLILKDKNGNLSDCYIFYNPCWPYYYKISICQSDKLGYLYTTLIPVKTKKN